MPFKIIQGHRDRYKGKAVCDFILVITRWHGSPANYPEWSSYLHESYIVNRQIGVEESKYRVTGDPPFTGREMQN